MQATGSHQKIKALFCLSLNLLMTVACHNNSAFDKAKARYQGTTVTSVAKVGTGLSYFSPDTLNPTWQADSQNPVVTIPNFTLLDQEGRERTASLFDDKITIVGFFFASCSGFCPFLVEGMKSIEKELGPLASQVQFVALSVNPEDDTPQRLKAYAKERKLDTDSSWTLLTGQRETIYNLAKKTFASQVFRRASPNANFVHSEHVYIIDANHHLRGILNGTRIDIRHDAKRIVQQLLER